MPYKDPEKQSKSVRRRLAHSWKQAKPKRDLVSRESEIFRRYVGERKYEKLGFEFQGWPADGLWWVDHNASRSCLIATPEQVEAITPLTLGALATTKDRVVRAVLANINRESVSINDIVEAIFHELARTRVGFGSEREF